MSRIMLSCLLFLSSATAHASSYYVEPSPGILKVLLVPDAIALFQQYLDEHPDSANGWSSLGGLYANAYARGMDAIEVIHDASSGEPPNAQGIGIPPMTAARRLDSVSGPRLNYLVQALRAYQQAVQHSDSKDKEAALLGLGYVLYECRDRFVNFPWPLDGTPFDAEAKEHGAEPRWWLDQALAAFRQIEMPESNNEEDLWGSQDSGRTKSAVALYVVQISQDRSSRTEEEEKELIKFKKTADRYLESQSMYPPIKPALPPQPMEIETLYPVTPAGTATAEVYLRALDALLMEVNSFHELPIVGPSYDGKYQGKPLSPELLQNIGSYLGHHAETFRLLSEAARGQECRYPIDFNKGEAVELPFLAALRQLGRVQALRVLRAAESGDSTTITTAISDSIALADSLRREPLIISQLVRIALIGILVEALQDAQNRMALDSNDLQVLQERLATLEGLNGLVVAFKGESFRMQMEMGKPVEEEPIPDTPHMSAEERTDMIKYMKQHAASRPTAQDVRQVYDAMLAAVPLPFADAREEIERAGTEGTFMNPSMARALVAFYRSEAMLRTAQIALAVDRYSRTNSGPPASLNDLVPVYIRSLPLDPFTDEPMRYQLLDGGFVVYSVGDNLVDDNSVKMLQSGHETVRYADLPYKVGVFDETEEGDAHGF